MLFGSGESWWILLLKLKIQSCLEETFEENVILYLFQLCRDLFPSLYLLQIHFTGPASGSIASYI